MDRTQLLQHFETLAETPEAPAKLRKFVLSLAVRGQLLPQKAEEEKHARWEEFAAKLSHPDSQDEDEPPFLIPRAWRWARLNDVADYRAADKVAPSEIKDDAWVLDLEEIEKDTSRLLQIARFAEKQSSSTKAKFLAGDVLYCKLRPYLNKVVVAPQQGFCTTEIVPIRSRGISEPAYLCLYLRSPDFVSYANSKSYGMKMPRLGTEDAESAWIAVPPPPEQRRIVAKVEELLALCEELETRQAAALEHRARLVRSALDHLTTVNGARVCDPQHVARRTESEKRSNISLLSDGCGSQSRAPQDDFHRHAAFVMREFPQLTAALEDVSALRQAILSLAVQGRLVPGECDSVPSSWRSVTVGEVADHRLGKMLDHQKNRGTPRPYLRNTNVHWFRFELSSIKELRIEDDELENYELRRGDVLICEGGHGIGRTAVWESNETGVVFQKALHRVRLCKHLNGYFFAFCMKVYADARILEQYFTGAGIPHLTGKSLGRLKFPLPSLAEQHRIVAKVDELMRWCDALEARLTAAQTTATHLLDATLRRILDHTSK